MAVAILRKPDAGGVRIDVSFRDRDDAGLVWIDRNRGTLAAHVQVRSEANYRMPDHAEFFLMEAAVLVAREYLKLDPLDEPGPTA